jgi:hypothetical protein
MNTHPISDAPVAPPVDAPLDALSRPWSVDSCAATGQTLLKAGGRAVLRCDAAGDRARRAFSYLAELHNARLAVERGEPAGLEPSGDAPRLAPRELVDHLGELCGLEACEIASSLRGPHPATARDAAVLVLSDSARLSQAQITRLFAAIVEADRPAGFKPLALSQQGVSIALNRAKDRYAVDGWFRVLVDRLADRAARFVDPAEGGAA